MSDGLPKNEVLCPSCHQWTDGRYTDGLGEKGIEGRARELLEIGKSLLELDEEANSLGTDSWAWLRQVEDFLAASSNPASVQSSLESLKLEIRKQAWQECEEACMEIILGSLPVMAAVDCDHMAVALDARDRDVRLKARKQAFEEAAEHEPSDYNGSEWDWECDCGVHGHWTGDDSWKTHIRSLASALAVNEEPEGKRLIDDSLGGTKYEES